jgi:parallel beta-helix repeat protein
MKLSSLLVCSLCFLFFSCSTSVKSLLGKLKAGEAIIQKQDGKFSEALSVAEAFKQLKNNEKLYLAPGRAILSTPIKIENLSNVQIIGEGSSLVAKEDMPVLTLKKVSNVTLKGFLVVHEIGEWCSQNCVEFYDAKDLDIQDCKFDGSGYFGLALTDVSNAKVKNCKFFNCEYGLAAWKSSNIEAKGNTFSKNRGEDILVDDPDQYANDVQADNTFE